MPGPLGLMFVSFFKYMRANKFIIRVHEKLQLYSVQLVIEAKFTGLK